MRILDSVTGELDIADIWKRVKSMNRNPHDSSMPTSIFVTVLGH